MENESSRLALQVFGLLVTTFQSKLFGTIMAKAYENKLKVSFRCIDKCVNQISC